MIDLFEHQFMRNAFLAVMLLTPLFALLGTMIVNNGMAFFSDSLGHGAFTGMAIGTLLGLQSPTFAALIFSVVFALGITAVRHRGDGNTDTIIGVFSSAAVALGLFLATFGGTGINKYSSYLIGDILTVSIENICLLAVVLILVVITWFFFYNQLLLVSLNRVLANSRGIKSERVEGLFTCLVAVVVTVSIQWVGLLIVNSLLILPAAAARNISGSIRQYHRLSLVISMLSGVLGLVASYYFNTATGATIVIVAALFYFLTLGISIVKR